MARGWVAGDWVVWAAAAEGAWAAGKGSVAACKVAG